MNERIFDEARAREIFLERVLPNGSFDASWQLRSKRTVQDVALVGDLLVIACKGVPASDTEWLREFYGDVTVDAEGGTLIRVKPEFYGLYVVGDASRPFRLSLSFERAVGKSHGLTFVHVPNCEAARAERIAEQHRNRIGAIARKELRALLEEGKWCMTGLRGEDGKWHETYTDQPVEANIVVGELTLQWGGSRIVLPAKRTEIRAQYKDGVPVELKLYSGAVELARITKRPPETEDRA